MKTNHLSLLYAGLILFLVFFSKIKYGIPEKLLLQEAIDSTTITLSEPPPTTRNFVFREPKSRPEIAVVALPVILPEISVAAALSEDLKSGKRFLEKDGYRHWPLASLTKLMTAIVAVEKIGLGKSVVFDEETVATEGIGGGWQAGDRATVSELIQTMVVVSSNDAAEALAKFYGRPEFLEEMAAKARELGMSETVFVDPSGLSITNQSTIEDVRQLVRYVFSRHPQILEWSRQPEIEILGRKLLNINKFAGRPEWLGGKTGFLDEAGGNLVSIFEYQNRPILIIIFGADDRFVETEKIYDWISKITNIEP